MSIPETSSRIQTVSASDPDNPIGGHRYHSLQKSVYLLPVVIADGERPTQSSTNTLTVRVCTCDRDGNMQLCNAEALTARAGLSTGALVAILLCSVILLMMVVLSPVSNLYGFSSVFSSPVMVVLSPVSNLYGFSSVFSSPVMVVLSPVSNLYGFSSVFSSPVMVVLSPVSNLYGFSSVFSSPVMVVLSPVSNLYGFSSVFSSPVMVIVVLFAALRRQRKKEPLIISKEDVRDNVVSYNDEGGGEEDTQAFDIGALRNPEAIEESKQRRDIVPEAFYPPVRRPVPMPPAPMAAHDPNHAHDPNRAHDHHNGDVREFISQRLHDNDSDPTAPPYDSLATYAYEGSGSVAESLSSLESVTTDGDQDYNYLSEWGPRFKKLADMYGADDSDRDS
ncbi:hypothetical protein CRUP_027742 [Coryphaenoides rupestris]|nr:hypothetical protein CRUP_027742 [Coryphaenoides rupestris]